MRRPGERGGDIWTEDHLDCVISPGGVPKKKASPIRHHLRRESDAAPPAARTIPRDDRSTHLTSPTRAGHCWVKLYLEPDDQRRALERLVGLGFVVGSAPAAALGGRLRAAEQLQPLLARLVLLAVHLGGGERGRALADAERLGIAQDLSRRPRGRDGGGSGAAAARSQWSRANRIDATRSQWVVTSEPYRPRMCGRLFPRTNTPARAAMR